MNNNVYDKYSILILFFGRNITYKLGTEKLIYMYFPHRLADVLQ